MSRAWYFEGYEFKSDPATDAKKPHGGLVYTGEYYGLRLSDTQNRQLKALVAVDFSLYVAVYLLLSLCPTEGARRLWVSVPLLAALLPSAYLGIGVGGFLAAGRKWPKRLVRSVYHRIRWSSLLAAIFLLVSLVAEVSALFSGYAFCAEAPYLLGLTAELFLVLAFPLLQRKFPVRLANDQD